MKKHTSVDTNFASSIPIVTGIGTVVGIAAFGPLGLLVGGALLVGGLIGCKTQREELGRELSESGDDEAHDRAIQEMRAQGHRSGVVHTEFDYGDPAPLNPFYTTKVRRTTYWSDDD